MRAVFFRREGASRNHRRAEEREVIMRDMDRLHLQRMIAAGEIHPGFPHVIAGHLAKHSRLLAPEIELRNAGAIECTLRGKQNQSHERLRIGVGQRLQQYGIYYGKDPAVLTPIPRAITRTATVVNPGAFRSERRGVAEISPDVFRERQRDR